MCDGGGTAHSSADESYLRRKGNIYNVEDTNFCRIAVAGEEVVILILT